jgi:hypothetical protein
MNTMPNVFKIADILVAHAQRAHPGEIGIIAYYGSYAKGTASPTSDLDIFYIPDEGKARSLCTQFIIDGLPYDFWPVSWQLAHDITNASSHRPWAVSASLIADARALYHRSQEDLDRFTGLQARIVELTRPESRKLMVGKGLAAFKTTLFWLGQMRHARAGGDVVGMRWAGNQVVDAALNCLALVNQTYFSKGWGSNLDQALAMEIKPDGLEYLVRGLIMAQEPGSMLKQAERLAREVRATLRQAARSVAEPVSVQEVFEDSYFYYFEYKNKVLSACERGDIVAALYAACYLQQDLTMFTYKAASGVEPTDFDLLGEYSEPYVEAGFPDLLGPASRGDLVELARRVCEFDDQVRQWFERHAILLNILESEEELIKFLERRDPAQEKSPTPPGASRGTGL